VDQDQEFWFGHTQREKREKGEEREHVEERREEREGEKLVCDQTKILGHGPHKCFSCFCHSRTKVTYMPGIMLNI
jgi:hypothetical protein